MTNMLETCILFIGLTQAGSRTSVLELVLGLVQKLVHEVQMVGSRTSVLELVLELDPQSRTSFEVLEPAICTP